MSNILSVCISSFSIIIAVILIMYHYFSYGIKGLEGAGWILAVLGAPTTLLDFFIYKLGISKGNIIADLVWVTLFYLIQYLFPQDLL